MAEIPVKEEGKLSNGGKTIMELVAEEYFAAKELNDPTKAVTLQNESAPHSIVDNKAYLNKTTKFPEEDKGKIKHLEEHIELLKENCIPENKPEHKYNKSTHENEIQLLNVVDNIKTEHIQDLKSSCKHERGVSANILNAVDVETVFADDTAEYKPHKHSINILSNKCIIKEISFNFSMYKTPMKDAASPYHIDKNVVPVDIYQDGLVNRWNPTQVVYELCSQCEWHPPVFVQHDYTLCRGYHVGVGIKDCHFVPADRGATKKLAKHTASAFFLHFLGFKFRFNDSKRLALRFSDSLSRRKNKTRLTSSQFNNNCMTQYYRNTVKRRNYR